MKFTINKESLLNKLKFCNEIVDSSSINPILSNLLINVNEDNIEFICSNQLISSKTTIKNNISIFSTGNILIKTNLLFNIISKINEDKITFDLVDNSIIHISTNKFTLDLNVLESYSYPVINFSFENKNKITINKQLFNKITNKTSLTVLESSDQTNIFTGINLNSNRLDNKIEILSTDSYHLSYLQEDFTNDKFDITLSLKVVKLINSLLKESKSDCNFYLDQNNILFEINNTIISTRLLDGKYHSSPYKILQNTYPYSFTTSKKEMIDSINRGLVLLSSDNSKKPTVQMIINNKELNLNFKSIELGSCYEKINIEDYKGSNIQIILNIKYLLDLLKEIETDKIEFHFINERGPILIKEVNDKNFITLISPCGNN